MVITAREAALRALAAWRRDKAWPELALGGIIERFGLPARDAALATRILGGVLQNMALCDHYITHFSSVEQKKIEPRILDVLRISVYQLLFLDKVPPSAAVNEGVALAKKSANPRAAGFVNAVLRKIAQAAKDGALPDVEGDIVQRLATRYSHPAWLVRELCGILGPDSAESLLAANNAPDLPAFAQVNTLLADLDGTLGLLAADGVEAARHERLDGCIELRGARDIARLEAFMKGHIYMQDAAARIAVLAAAPAPGNLVIDGCAAPGGKSFAAAIAMGNVGKIIARDISAAKLRRVGEGAKRLGISIIETIVQDASVPAAGSDGMADVVLADVPCSGFGVVRKKPEIRYKTEQETDGLPAIQERILSALSTYVKPGGTLLYSTCTVLRRENESVVESFLRGHSQFGPEGFAVPGAGQVSGGMVTLWPHIHGTDGFFICKLRRNGH